MMRARTPVTSPPDTLGSLSPAQSAQLRNLLAAVGPGEIVRAVGISLQRTSESRGREKDHGGALEFLRSGKLLVDLSSDLPSL